MVKKWNEIDWQWRIVIGIALFAAIFSAVSVFLFFNAHGRQLQNALAAKGDILIEWLAERNIAPLDKETSILRTPEVIEAVLFDSNANVLVPVSMRGKKFRDTDRFNQLISNRGIKKYKNEEGLEIFRSVYDSSGNVEALAYLKLSAERSFPWEVAAQLLFVFLCFGACVFWILFETKRTLQNFSRNEISRFDLLQRITEHRICYHSNILKKSFEDEWRRLIYSMDRSVMILDKNYRLVEMNESAFKRFHGDKSLAEGSHVLELLKNDDAKRSVVDALGSLNKVSETKMTVRNDDEEICIFKTLNELSGFKYTVVCSGGSGVL